MVAQKLDRFSNELSTTHTEAAALSEGPDGSYRRHGIKHYEVTRIISLVSLTMKIEGECSRIQSSHFFLCSPDM